MISFIRGIRDVIVELSSGMSETFQDISRKCDEIHTMLMGSYQEIEALEKLKEARKLR